MNLKSNFLSARCKDKTMPLAAPRQKVLLSNYPLAIGEHSRSSINQLEQWGTTKTTYLSELSDWLQHSSNSIHCGPTAR
jgi:type IV secretory pathway ATPase VirB11/archaellum biosynthesis ATPase